jgi:hypothetical protein
MVKIILASNVLTPAKKPEVFLGTSFSNFENP